MLVCKTCDLNEPFKLDADLFRRWHAVTNTSGEKERLLFCKLDCLLDWMRDNLPSDEWWQFVVFVPSKREQAKLKEKVDA